MIVFSNVVYFFEIIEMYIRKEKKRKSKRFIYCFAKNVIGRLKSKRKESKIEKWIKGILCRLELLVLF